MRFLDFLFPPRSDEQIVRETDTDAFLALVRPVLVLETRPPTIALLPFHNSSVRAALHEAKYHGSERAFAHLAHALADYLADMDTFVPQKTRIVPVPLGSERQKERGFNQAEEVVKRAVQGLEIQVETGLLVRVRETTSQVSLPRHEREKNIRGAFRSTRPADPRYLYIVIDDVITTGATLQAATLALREAGATDITPLALAH